jgi:hypothetical protein
MDTLEKEKVWEMKCPYKEGDEYWSLCDDGYVYKESWWFIGDDEERFEAGNAFPTQQAAQREAKRRNLLTRFRAFRDECNGDWKADWKKQDKKYFLYYSQKFDIISIDYINICEKFNLFGYFKNEQDAKRAIELFGDEIKKLFIDCECD